MNTACASKCKLEPVHDKNNPDEVIYFVCTKCNNVVERGDAMFYDA